MYVPLPGDSDFAESAPFSFGLILSDVGELRIASSVQGG